MQQSGKVFLVGAGPGDPELLTVKALRILRQAEIIVFDRLVSNDVLDLAPAHASRIDVGKQARCHPVPQHEINALIIRLAQAGKRVVRLKGGDPFIFGRGGEEAIALAKAGIPFEVIPGVTAAQACAASAGVPLTHRGIANGVRYLTGHIREDGGLDFDWRGLCDPQTTLVIYMGLASIPEITERLLAEGCGAETPVLAVSMGTTVYERRLLSSLGRIAHDLGAAKLVSPALFIIGEVAALSAILGQESDAISPQVTAAE
jgi:uroporphyrin-III C-methyltransferase